MGENDLEEVGDNGDDKKCSDFEYIWKIQPIGHTKGLNVVAREKRSQSLMVLT